MGNIEKSDKSKFLNNFESLRPDLFFPETWTDEQREKAVDLVRPQKTRTSMFSSIPMNCEASKCHPAGTLIRTNLGLIPIEDLNTNTHLIVAWDRNCQAIRGGFDNGNIKGYPFVRVNRNFSDLMIKVSTNSCSHEVTFDHISIAKWSDKAMNAYAVYLMTDDINWRVGKVKLFSGQSENKKAFGPSSRASTEKATKLWILGIYNSEIEALLAEEFFSISGQISKSCFVTLNNSNWNGLYKHITQDKLTEHHNKCNFGFEHYKKFLMKNNLRYEYPFWEKNRNNEILDNQFGLNSIFYINSINLISDFMMAPQIPDDLERGKWRVYKTEWNEINIEKYEYKGIVYSLDVEKHHTYFANEIATHNCTFADTCPLLKENLAPRGKPCPIEMSIVSQFTAEYMEQLDVHPDNLVEVSMIRDLVDQEVQYIRKTKLLAKEHFIQENIIGVDNDGMPILKKELHLAVELEDRLHRRRKDLRNQLLATREAKAKVGQTQLDSAQAISDILFKVQSLENQREKLLKQKLGIYDKDDYIEIPSSEIKE
jgi:hypothetical protein